MGGVREERFTPEGAAVHLEPNVLHEQATRVPAPGDSVGRSAVPSASSQRHTAAALAAATYGLTRVSSGQTLGRCSSAPALVRSGRRRCPVPLCAVSRRIRRWASAREAREACRRGQIWRRSRHSCRPELGRSAAGSAVGDTAVRLFDACESHLVPAVRKLATLGDADGQRLKDPGRHVVRRGRRGAGVGAEGHEGRATGRTGSERRRFSVRPTFVGAEGRARV